MASALSTLTALIRQGLPAPGETGFDDRVRSATEAVLRERYYSTSKWQARIALTAKPDFTPFAGLIHPDEPSSGVYGGFSLIWFPSKSDEGGDRSLLTFVCGTRGLAPDEEVLTRPGHARLLQALARRIGNEAWAKRDPANISSPLPIALRQRLARHKQALERYGNFLSFVVELPVNDAAAENVVRDWLDFYAMERGWTPLAAARDQVGSFRADLLDRVFPAVTQQDVADLLERRRFVVLEGPPGTGKTRLAHEILKHQFKGHGTVVQFHPAVTYENFIAGIRPSLNERELGFEIAPGWLIQAIDASQGGPFLLVIDEVNRADLGKVLGEAIALFEPREIAAGEARTVALPYPLPDGRTVIAVPKNLYVLGTMNSADRSIAILDLAVRRRFAFVDIWPDGRVVEEHSTPAGLEAFRLLQQVFLHYAPAGLLTLLPGHSYFMAKDDDELKARLRYEVAPLLREYLLDHRLGECEREIEAYLDTIAVESDG